MNCHVASTGLSLTLASQACSNKIIKNYPRSLIFLKFKLLYLVRQDINF